MDAAFDRFVMFVSADFFVNFWKVLVGTAPGRTVIEQIQSAGRIVVTDFVGVEDVYWNIDFSMERQAASERLYFKSLQLKTAGDARFEEALRGLFSGEHLEQVSADFAMSFIYRVVNDLQFRAGSGISESDASILGACLPNEAEELDSQSMIANWLRADSRWDMWVRSLTPDVPDYVVSVFLGVRRQSFQLPTLIENLRLVLEPDQFPEMVGRIQRHLIAALATQPNLKVPSALTAAT